MNLFFIIDSFGSGGAQRQMIILANGLAQKGHKITFFIYYPSYDHFSALLDHRVKVISYRKRNKYSVSIVAFLYKLLRSSDYDCILSFLSTPSVYAELLSILKINIPVIASVRNSYPHNKIPLKRKFTEQFHRSARFVTVNTHYQRMLMEKRYPWIQEKIITIYNGVDTQLFKPSYIKQNNNIHDIIGIGSIRRLKNIRGIISGLYLYKLENKNCPLISWAGKIPTMGEDYQEYKTINTLLKKYQLSSNWEWLGERNDIPILLRNHDALIIGSLHEGLPNVICEAFASGIPVIASNVCEHPKIIREGHTGFLFDPLDHKSIAQSIKSFVNTPYEKRHIMGINARIFAENHFSLYKYIESYEKLFIKIRNN